MLLSQALSLATPQEAEFRLLAVHPSAFAPLSGRLKELRVDAFSELQIQPVAGLVPAIASALASSLTVLDLQVSHEQQMAFRS